MTEAWILSLLLAAVPASRWPDAAERYPAIAVDIAAAAAEDPAPRDAAALLVAVAVLESGLSPDVDRPTCAPALVRRGGCDGGRAVSLWQIHGYQLETRREAAAVALRLIRRSQRACAALPAEERLAAYAAGGCASSAGRRLSRVRMALAARLLSR